MQESCSRSLIVKSPGSAPGLTFKGGQFHGCGEASFRRADASMQRLPVPPSQWTAAELLSVRFIHVGRPVKSPNSPRGFGGSGTVSGIPAIHSGAPQRLAAIRDSLFLLRSRLHRSRRFTLRTRHSSGWDEIRCDDAGALALCLDIARLITMYL